MKIAIYGISFSGSRNWEYLRETIRFVLSQLIADEISVNSQIVSYQSEKSFVPFDFKKHDKHRRKLGRKLFNSLQPGLVFNFKHQIISLLAVKLKRGHFKGRSGKTYGWRQLNLTNKHIFLWQSFLESDDDFLLVLEDDATINPKNSLAILEVFSFLAKMPKRPVFVNLIHQFDLHSNYIKTDLPLINEHSFYSKTLANTTGAYIVNREMAAQLFEVILVNPGFRVAGADWLIGLLSLQVPNPSKNICLNIVPGFFTNSSLDSNLSSLES
jgi:hypothetical protein